MKIPQYQREVPIFFFGNPCKQRKCFVKKSWMISNFFKISARFPTRSSYRHRPLSGRGGDGSQITHPSKSSSCDAATNQCQPLFSRWSCSFNISYVLLPTWPHPIITPITFSVRCPQNKPHSRLFAVLTFFLCIEKGDILLWDCAYLCKIMHWNFGEMGITTILD